MRYNVHFNVAGVSFGGRQGLLHYTARAQKVHITLWRERDNKQDPNAIKVMVNADNKRFPVGYVPRELAKILAPRMDNKIAFIHINAFRITGHGCNLRGMELEISWEEEQHNRH